MGNQTTTIAVGNTFQQLTGWPAKQVRVSNPSDTSVLVRRGTAAFHAEVEPGSWLIFPVQVHAGELALKRATAGSDVDVTVTYGPLVEGAPDVTEPGAGGPGGGPDLSSDAPEGLAAAADAGNGTEASRADHKHVWPVGSTDISNTAGDENVTVPAEYRDYVVEADIEGAARTSKFILKNTNRRDNDRLRLALNLPAAGGGIVIDARNQTAGGTQLIPNPMVLARDNAVRVVVDFKFKDGVWQADALYDPALES